MSLQLSAQVYLKHDEASNSYYLFCLDNGKHYRLNETSFEIVKMVQKGRKKNEIASWIHETYDVAIDICTKDIEELFSFLLENNLLH
jgi:Coenzyme PQQ synthesis protein D (PqqD)